MPGSQEESSDDSFDQFHKNQKLLKDRKEAKRLSRNQTGTSRNDALKKQKKKQISVTQLDKEDIKDPRMFKRRGGILK